MNFENEVTDLGYGGLSWNNTQGSVIYTATNIDGHKHALAMNLNGGSSGDKNHSGVRAYPADYDIWTHPWTIDFWRYRTGYNIVSQTHGGVAFEACRISESGETIYNDLIVDIIRGGDVSGDNKTCTVATAAAYTWPPNDNVYHDLNIDWNSWTHIAVSFDTNTYYLFKNGTLINTYNLVDSSYLNYNILIIGSGLIKSDRSDWARYFFRGYLDMFRISNICRWTTDFDLNTMYKK